MGLYVLKPNRGSGWWHAALYAASLYKEGFAGVYYDPVTGLYAPVFSMDRLACPHRRFFTPVGRGLLERSYRMVCIRCGACCARNSGAFAYPHELPGEAKGSLPASQVRVPVFGSLTVYWLDTGPAGRCAFFNMSSATCNLSPKPISCLVHYCTLFAEKNGKMYVKVAVKNGKMVYRQARPGEVERLAQAMRAKVQRFLKKGEPQE